MLCVCVGAQLNSLFAEIKEEAFDGDSSTSSVLQIAVFTQCVSVPSRALVCSTALSE